MAGPRVTLQPIPLTSTAYLNKWLAYASTAGYDSGSPGGTITPWGSAQGVQIPNPSGNVILVWATGSSWTSAAVQVLVGETVAGANVLPATAVTQTLAAGAGSGWLGPWSPATYNQKNPAGVTYSGAANTQALTASAQGCVVVDFPATANLVVAAFGIYPVYP